MCNNGAPWRRHVQTQNRLGLFESAWQFRETDQVKPSFSLSTYSVPVKELQLHSRRWFDTFHRNTSKWYVICWFRFGSVGPEKMENVSVPPILLRVAGSYLIFLPAAVWVTQAGSYQDSRAQTMSALLGRQHGWLMINHARRQLPVDRAGSTVIT